MLLISSLFGGMFLFWEVFHSFLGSCWLRCCPLASQKNHVELENYLFFWRITSLPCFSMAFPVHTGGSAHIKRFETNPGQAILPAAAARGKLAIPGDRPPSDSLGFDLLNIGDGLSLGNGPINRSVGYCWIVQPAVESPAYAGHMFVQWKNVFAGQPSSNQRSCASEPLTMPALKI